MFSKNVLANLQENAEPLEVVHWMSPKNTA